MIRAGGTPQSLSSGSSPTFAGLTLTGPILAPDGTAAAPSYSFANEPGTGFSRGGTGVVNLSFQGTQGVRFDNSNGNRVITDIFALGLASPDVLLTRDAANTLAQRNGVNAQAFRLYNTYTDAANYERGFTDWNANIFRVGTSSSGTGAARQMQVGTFGNNSLQIVTNAIGIWQFQASGHLLALTDNSYDIGTAGANRPRNIYAGSAIFTTAPNTQTGTTYTVLATDNYLIANAAATQTLTLPTASTNTGRLIRVKTIAAFTVVSASSNVVPLAGGAAGTAILAATAGKWADLVSDGTNWVIMAGN